MSKPFDAKVHNKPSNIVWSHLRRALFRTSQGYGVQGTSIYHVLLSTSTLVHVLSPRGRYRAGQVLLWKWLRFHNDRTSTYTAVSLRTKVVDQCTSTSVCWWKPRCNVGKKILISLRPSVIASEPAETDYAKPTAYISDSVAFGCLEGSRAEHLPSRTDRVRHIWSLVIVEPGHRHLIWTATMDGGLA